MDITCGWCVLTGQICPYEDCYRLVLICRATLRVLAQTAPLDVTNAARATHAALSLPRLSIPRWSRVAPQIQARAQENWGIQVFVLTCLDGSTQFEPTAIAETRDEFAGNPGTQWVNLDELADTEIGVPDSLARTVLEDIVEHGYSGHGPFVRLGWVQEVLDWVSSTCSGCQPRKLKNIRQLNASSQHSLLRLEYESGRSVWYKAAAQPGDLEFERTLLLSRLFPEYLPGIVAVHRECRGWLMEDAGLSAENPGFLTTGALERIGARLASLQQASISHTRKLMERGVADHRISELRMAVRKLLPYFEEAVRSQRSTALPRIMPWRVKEIFEGFEEACCLVEELDLPSTLVHDDLNVGNILMSNGACVFTDWAEASVGIPLVAIEQVKTHFIQNVDLAYAMPGVLRSYRHQWYNEFSQAKFDKAMSAIRPLALAAHMATRTDWILQNLRGDLALQRYLRSLVRQMEEAIQPELASTEVSL